MNKVEIEMERSGFGTIKVDGVKLSATAVDIKLRPGEANLVTIEVIAPKVSVKMREADVKVIEQELIPWA